MIDISKLTEADKQREVRYNYKHMRGYEVGRITSWNYMYIFVRYLRSVTPCLDDQWIEFPIASTMSQATRPEDLEFV